MEIVVHAAIVGTFANRKTAVWPGRGELSVNVKQGVRVFYCALVWIDHAAIVIFDPEER